MTQSQDAGRRIVLHLGMLKTGSTSIQAVFSGYRDERIEYAYLGHDNHSLVLQRSFGDRASAKVFRSADPEQQEMQRDAARKRLAAALDGTPRSVILSAEGIYRFDAGCAGRCGEFLRARADRIDPIVYVRAPASYARSVFQERLKWGSASFDLSRILPAYRERAMTWAEALGGVEPTHVLFDRSTLHEGDVVADFGWRLGLDPTWARERAGLQNRNSSLSAEATAALYLLRHRRGAPTARGVEWRRVKAFLEVLGGFGTRRFDFGPDILARALDARAKDIAWVESRLGRSFPEDRVRDPVIFGSEADILEFAEAQAPALADHLEAQGLVKGARGRSTLEMLDALAERGTAVADLRREIGSQGHRLKPLLRSLAGRIVAALR